MNDPLGIAVAVLIGGGLLVATIWSLYLSVPRFALFVIGALGFPVWLFAIAILPGIGKLVLILATLYLGFAAFAAFHYRQVRRSELLQLLATAAKSQLPIEEVLAQGLRDRSTHPIARIGSGLFHLLVPWFWFPASRYDEQMRRLVYYLDIGFPPAVALASVPGMASQETELALYVGESTGKLDSALDMAQRSQRSLAPALLENLPRTFYLGSVLSIWFISWLFVVVFITPKFEKIFADFRIRLPESTEMLIGFGRSVTRHGGFVMLGVLLLFGLMGALFCSSTVRWHVPLVRRIVRPWMQSRCLAMLGALMEAGKTAPRSLELLRHVPLFAGAVARRLTLIQYRVEQGRELIGELRNKEMLPPSFAPLASAAERGHTLPWAFQEMGEHLARRTLHRLMRLGDVVFPLLIVMLGGLTMWYAYAMFAPLVRMIEGLQ